MNEERLAKLEGYLEPRQVEISEDEVREIVWYILFILEMTSREEDGILHDVIRLKKCDIQHSENVFKKMKELGLKICHSGEGYLMRHFGSMRGYIPNDYFQFIGTDDSHWSDEEKDMFNKFAAEIEDFKKKVFDTINQGHPITVKN